MERAYHSAKTKQLIYDTALELFSQKGYEETRIQDIIDASGMSKGAIYYHFRDKSEIFEALCDEITEGGFSYLKDLIAGGQHSADQIMALFFEYVLNSPLKTKMLDCMWGQKNPHSIRKTLIQSVEVVAPLIARVIEQGVREGIYTCTQPLETAEVFCMLYDVWLDASNFSRTYTEYERRVDFLIYFLEVQGAPFFHGPQKALLMARIRPHCLPETHGPSPAPRP